jgi:dolichol-phosphate mannosyltransferase
MKLSVIIPVYNEENTILKVIKKIELLKLPYKLEIIIIDDGSTDSSFLLLRKIKNRNIKLYSHKLNLGKSAAIRTGLKHASGDLIIIQDSDLEYDPANYQALIRPILEHECAVVYGSRFMKNSILSRQKWAIPSHYFGNIILSFVTSLLYHKFISDMETGYKAFRREVIEKLSLTSEKFGFEPEITGKLLMKGIKIKEVPISYNPRNRNEGKKITWTDGVHAIFTLIQVRFS